MKRILCLVGTVCVAQLTSVGQEVSERGRSDGKGGAPVLPREFAIPATDEGLPGEWADSAV